MDADREKEWSYFYEDEEKEDKIKEICQIYVTIKPVYPIIFLLLCF